MSRTTVIVIVRLVLLILFIVVGYLVKAIGLRRALEDFLLAWFALAAGNLVVGVLEAGYTFGEELPIFLLIFAVPGVPAVAVRLWVGRRT